MAEKKSRYSYLSKIAPARRMGHRFRGDDVERLRSHKLVPPISLRIEQCGEVAVIVGAVADHQRIDVVEIEGLAQLSQRREFRGAAQDRVGDLSGQFAVAD